MSQEESGAAGAEKESPSSRKMDFVRWTKKKADASGGDAPHGINDAELVEVGDLGVIDGWDESIHREPRRDQFASELGYCRFKARRARTQEKDWRRRADSFQDRAAKLERIGETPEKIEALDELEAAEKRLAEARDKAKLAGIFDEAPQAFVEVDEG